MKRSAAATLAAIALGTAVFFLVGRFIVIPGPVLDTNISLQYGFLAFLAALYGPLAGAVTGFLGNLLIDLSRGGTVWWSWCLASAAFGGITGLCAGKLHIRNGKFTAKGVQAFNVYQIAGSLLAWTVLSPVLDVMIHSDDPMMSFLQGATAGSSNIIVTAILGTVLCYIYAAWKRKSAK